FDRGAIVDLGDGIEGFIPLSQLGIDDLKRPNDAFEVGEPLTMKVTRVDVPNHRLILSVKAWLSDQDDIALAEWTSKRNQVRARRQPAPRTRSASSTWPGASTRSLRPRSAGPRRASRATTAARRATARALRSWASASRGRPGPRSRRWRCCRRRCARWHSSG